MLRLAPVNDDNSRRLASLLSTQGLLEAEIEQSAALLTYTESGKLSAESEEAANRHLALLRSRGDVNEIRAFAEKMGRQDVVAAMALFDGDPRPYLRWQMERDSQIAVAKVYAEERDPRNR